MRRHGTFGLGQDELAFELAALRLQVGVGREHRSYSLAHDRTVRARRPCFRVRNDRASRRRHQMTGVIVVRPAATERSPGGERGVRQAPGLHFLDGPIGGGADVRRPGEPRSMDVRQIARDVHHLRSLQAFLFDPIDRLQVHGFTIAIIVLTGERRRQNRGSRHQDHQAHEDRAARAGRVRQCHCVLTHRVNGARGVNDRTTQERTERRHSGKPEISDLKSQT